MLQYFLVFILVTGSYLRINAYPDLDKSCTKYCLRPQSCKSDVQDVYNDCSDNKSPQCVVFCSQSKNGEFETEYYQPMQTSKLNLNPYITENSDAELMRQVEPSITRLLSKIHSNDEDLTPYVSDNVNTEKFADNSEEFSLGNNQNQLNSNDLEEIIALVVEDENKPKGGDLWLKAGTDINDVHRTLTKGIMSKLIGSFKKGLLDRLQLVSSISRRLKEGIRRLLSRYARSTTNQRRSIRSTSTEGLKLPKKISFDVGGKVRAMGEGTLTAGLDLDNGIGGAIKGKGKGRIIGEVDGTVQGPGFNLEGKGKGDLSGEVEGGLGGGLSGFSGNIKGKGRGTASGTVTGNILGQQLSAAGTLSGEGEGGIEGDLAPVLSSRGIGLGGQIKAGGKGSLQGKATGRFGKQDINADLGLQGAGNVALKGEAGLGLGNGGLIGGNFETEGSGAVTGELNANVGGKDFGVKGKASGAFKGSGVGDLTGEGIEGTVSGAVKAKAQGEAHAGAYKAMGTAQVEGSGTGVGTVGLFSGIKGTLTGEGEGEARGKAGGKNIYVQGKAGGRAKGTVTGGIGLLQGVYATADTLATGRIKGEAGVGDVDSVQMDFNDPFFTKKDSSWYK